MEKELKATVKAVMDRGHEVLYVCNGQIFYNLGSAVNYRETEHLKEPVIEVKKEGLK